MIGMKDVVVTATTAQVISTPSLKLHKVWMPLMCKGTTPECHNVYIQWPFMYSNSATENHIRLKKKHDPAFYCNRNYNIRSTKFLENKKKHEI